VASPRRRYAEDLLRRIGPFLLFFGAVYIIAGVAFYLVEGGRFSLFDSFYWSIATLGTVGYGDVVPTSATSKVLATFVIMTQIFLLGYLITLITSAVNEEARRRELGTYGTALVDHIVVLGYSAVGRAAVRELLLQDQTIAVVVESADQVPNVRALADERRLFVTYGAAAEREILERVNVGAAHAVIICTPDDATNMIGALNVRALAPKTRVVVSVARPELRETLRTAGVTFVASPADMGGRLCASAAFEPDVATAVEELTAAEVGGDVQEYVVGPSSPLTGRTIGEAERLIRDATGCVLIGIARPAPSGEFTVEITPDPKAPIAPGQAVVILGSVANTRRFRPWFGAAQGR